MIFNTYWGVFPSPVFFKIWTSGKNESPKSSLSALFGFLCHMRHTLCWALVGLFFLFSACADKYNAYKTLYQLRSPNGQPDYSRLDYWAAHPWKTDPSDSIPAPLKNDLRDTVADVFFLHPTTYTKRMDGPNARIDDSYLNAKTDYSTILYQASAFNQHCRVFAPRYRQAHISNFFRMDKEKELTAQAFDLAYQDIKTAFEYYLRYWNQGRPIIIASHSQGSLMAERLLKEYFEGKPLMKNLVAAYVIGWPVPKTYFTTLSMCESPDQTGCICSWRTFRRNYVPRWLGNENGNSYVTNPLTWTSKPGFVRRKNNKGSVLKDFNKIYLHTADAEISNGLLYTRKSKFPWSFLFMTKNYHVGDINLYYINLRENVAERISSYLRQ